MLSGAGSFSIVKGAEITVKNQARQVFLQEVWIYRYTDKNLFAVSSESGKVIQHSSHCDLWFSP